MNSKPCITSLCIGRMSWYGYFIYIGVKKTRSRPNVSENVFFHVRRGVLVARLWNNGESLSEPRRIEPINDNFLTNEPWFIGFLMEFWSEFPEKLQVVLARVMMT